MKSATETTNSGPVKHDIIEIEDTTIYADSFLNGATKVIEEAIKTPPPQMPNLDEIQARIRSWRANLPVTGAYPVRGKPGRE